MDKQAMQVHNMQSNSLFPDKQCMFRNGDKIYHKELVINF
jgi:hypothetical protein